MKNRRIKHFVSAMSLAVMISAGSGGLAYAAEDFTPLMNGVDVKAVGDRFSITEFNDIWRFIKDVFVGDNDSIEDLTDDRIGIGANPRIIANDGTPVKATFDIGGATVPGVLAADQLCDDTSCTNVSDILSVTDGGGGVLGTFVGLTTAKSDGAMTGYAGANTLCQVDYLGSHLCSASEMLASIYEVDISGWGSLEDGWVSTGNGKFPTTEETNDCNGWTHNTSGQYFGNFWSFSATGGIGKSSYCQQTIKLACCN